MVYVMNSGRERMGIAAFWITCIAICASLLSPQWLSHLKAVVCVVQDGILAATSQGPCTRGSALDIGNYPSHGLLVVHSISIAALSSMRCRHARSFDPPKAYAVNQLIVSHLLNVAHQQLRTLR